MSESTIRTVKKSLDENYQRVEIAYIENRKDLDELIQSKPDLVFSGVKYFKFKDPDEQLWLSDVLARCGINYTGSKKKALKLEINKIKAKNVLIKKNIRTSDFFVAIPGQFNESSKLPLAFPLFIKPSQEGCGKGIDENSLVRDFKSFEEKVLQLHHYEDNEILVEKYLSGREFTVAVLRNMKTNKLEAFPIELIPELNSRGDVFLSAQAKQEDLESIVAIKEIKLHEKLVRFAKKSFEALGARDYGRVDIRMGEDNELYFLEANLVPGLGGGYFVRAIAIGNKMSHSKIISRLAVLALNRDRL